MKGGWVDFVFMHLIYVHCVMSLSTLLEFVFFKRRLSLEMWLIDTGSVQMHIIPCCAFLKCCVHVFFPYGMSCHLIFGFYTMALLNTRF